jgi:hypothetical protein
MTAFTKFNTFLEDLGKEVHNFSTDQLKVALTNTDITSATTKYADISAGEPSGDAGYTAGGNNVTVSSWSQSGGAASLVLTDPATWTAATSLGPFKAAVLYNNSAPNKEAIGGWIYSTGTTLAATETFTVDLPTGAVLTIGP